ncbi:hypothetical protein J3A83DRAFT_4186502 [Scleroderma citrinum]
MSNVIQPSSEIPAVSPSRRIRERVSSSVSPPSNFGHNTNTQPDTISHHGHPHTTSLISPPLHNNPVADIRNGVTRAEEAITPTELGALATSNECPNEPVQPTLPTTNVSLPTSSATSSKPKSKRVLFDGVVIRSLPPQKRASSNSSASTSRRPPSTSTGTQLSLVDALRLTFNANNQPAPPPRGINDASSAPQTDAEAVTEDEQDTAVVPQRRLSPAKRRLTRHQASQSANLSESASEDTVIPIPDSVVSKKRLKAVPYNSIADAIDAALGTSVAPVWWDDEVDESESGRWAEESVVNDVSSDLIPWDNPGKGEGERQSGGGVPTPATSVASPNPISSLTAATSNVSLDSTGAFSPHVPMGDRFRQKLHLIFGEDAAVRTDRGARPRANSYEINYELLHTEHPEPPSPSSSSSTPEEDREQGSILNDGTFPAQPGAGPGIPPIPTYENAVTSGILYTAPSSSASRPSLKRRASREIYADFHHQNDGHNENGASMNNISAVYNSLATKRPRLDISEEQMQRWILSFQRLIKGKIRFTEEVCPRVLTPSVERNLTNNLNTDVVPPTAKYRACSDRFYQKRLGQ